MILLLLYLSSLFLSLFYHWHRNLTDKAVTFYSRRAPKFTMAPSNQQQANFQLRTNMDWEEIRRRLRSEYGSEVQSEAEISGVLADVDKDLVDCDAEFRRLQSGIIALQNPRKRLEEYKVSLRFLRSPIRRLPNETILRIFDYACEMNELTSKQLQTMPALAISGVCSRWRDLARSCPELWSRIELEMWTIPRHLPGLPILDLYLDSSKQSPLTLEFPSINAELQAAHLEVCAKLAACSDRWKKLATGPYEIYQAMMAQPFQFPIIGTALSPQYRL
ncbi:hypothetical protein BT96DRAFT_877595 [Gymnopus androsaceus JB14]|uniref:F-box domain-containing protein n=1 Tax=Gymnopus androsaceus JB14 TaxID=1447944 RepID=A0A6A4I111_9AGAR|nr:hypothetical protein BT96DRAFT_877595 [Gymnopus androsaceus JB14]